MASGARLGRQATAGWRILEGLGALCWRGYSRAGIAGAVHALVLQPQLSEMSF